MTLESFLKLCICECTWEAILHQLIGSFSHYLHLFIYRLYTSQVQDLFHQQHVESTLSHHLPVLYSSLPENKQPTGVSLPGGLGIIVCLLFEDAWSSGYNRKKLSAACTNRGNPHFRMICQFMDRRSMFQAGFCWGVPLGFQCLSVLWTRNSWRNKRSCSKDSRSLVGDVLWCQKQVAKHLMTAAEPDLFLKTILYNDIKLQRWDPSIR